jgi:hypothetical protein
MRKDDSYQIEKWAATSLRTVLVLLLTLTFCGPAAVAQSATFHANGQEAVVNSCPESPPTSIECIYVNVTEDASTGSAGQKTAFLTYDHSINDLNTGASQDFFGFGTIPYSAFQVHGQTASLDVDTSTVADFVNQFCTFVPLVGSTCDSAPGGVVTGTWNAMRNVFSFRIVGTLTETFPNMIVVSTEQQDAQAASASANVLGAMLSNSGNASVGSVSGTFSVHVRH